jgi:hypothetical protein
MALDNFLVKLGDFANTEWRKIKINHSTFGANEEYPCANPEGFVDNSDCPEDDPFCNCPCQEFRPDFNDEETGEDNSEPTNESLMELSESLKECDLIEEHLGEEWLGCLWNNLDHPSSCNCPCRGEKFKDYLEYTRTKATFWETPNQTPLWREAQMILLSSQKATLFLDGDLSLRVGELININSLVTTKNDTSRPRNFAGRWLVASIDHNILNSSHHIMFVTVVRDSMSVDPNNIEDVSYQMPDG